MVFKTAGKGTVGTQGICFKFQLPVKRQFFRVEKESASGYNQRKGF